MPIEVTKPGLSTTVQDLGRPGYYHLGIPISGGMDRYSTRAANLLVGNDPNDALLEIVFVGPNLLFTEAAVVALCGADMPVYLDGAERPGWEAFSVAPGQVLAFKFLKAGARAYLAVAGGIDVAPVLGSRSTYGLGALGGHEGRKLQAGDVLPIGPPKRAPSCGPVPADLRARLGTAELRVLPGLYAHRVREEALRRFFEDDWKVAPEADRVGYRFKGGAPLDFVPREPPFGAGSDPSNIVDSCYAYGSIQVPGGTEPIVLHRDAVSGGGYFTLGAVVSADLDSVAQLQPNASVRFAPVTMQQALQARREQGERVRRLTAMLT